MSRIDRCRSCQSHRLSSLLDLGRTPLANALRKQNELTQPQTCYPLHLVYCADCSLLQIDETVDPETLFGHYLYFSSFSDTMIRHARELATRVIAQRSLGSGSLVMEAASNDGYLLQHYLAAGVPVLGIEPAGNIAHVARQRGIQTVGDFFGPACADRLLDQRKQADVFHANNVLAHVADLNGFVASVARVLKPDGVAIIECPYAKEMLDKVEFDTIYHEHLCYFSFTALHRLFARHGLKMVRVERLVIHGGSLRLWATKAEATRTDNGSVAQLLAEEAAWPQGGVDRVEAYGHFARQVQTLKRDLLALLSGLKSQGKRIAAYGASAKGSTLLNYCGIGGETLDFVVDRSTVKQGLFTPGNHLPILSTEHLLKAMPDCTLLLTWNFAQEILQQQAEYQRRGGRFILPVPTPTILEPLPHAI